MKAMKRFASVCLVLVMLLTLSVTAFATELAGDEVFDCKVTVIFTDLTGEYPAETVTVRFKDVTGTVDKTVDLKLGETAEFVLPGPTTYNFVFEGVIEGYEVLDFFSYSPVATSFAVTGALKDFNWGIEKAGNAEQDATSVPSVDVNAVTARENVTVVNEEAEKVYLEFLEAVSFMANDESYYDGFGSLFAQCEKGSLNGDLYCQWYVENVQGGTEEEFFSMTAFERWLWTDTYTRLAYASGSGNYNMYYGSRAKYNTFIVKAAMNLVKGNNSDVIVSAYEKLMDWQWNYISKNGVPFNFIRNRSYIEEINAEGDYGSDTQAGDVPSATETTVEPESKETEEVTPSAPIEEEDEGIWDATMDILAENALTLVILVILVVAVLVVMYIRKSKNIYGE